MRRSIPGNFVFIERFVSYFLTVSAIDIDSLEFLFYQYVSLEPDRLFRWLW